MNYITDDLHPRRIQDLIEGLIETAGEGPEPFNADADALVEYIREVETWVAEILTPAVQSLIEVHRATGIDLKHWEPVLRLVQSTEPTFSIEGEPEW